jgi:outer membrane protein TolC
MVSIAVKSASACVKKTRALMAAATLLTIIGVAANLNAQVAAPMSTPSRAVQLPLSGMDPGAGSVSVTQRTANSTSGSVNVITSNVTAQRPYNGSVAGDPVAGDLSLTLKDALARGLHANLGVLTQSAAEQQARGQRAVAKSELLPHLNTTISEEFERVNLRTQGVEVSTFPESVQFNFFDARARLTQSVFDLVQLQNLHSADQSLRARVFSAKDSRDLVVLAVAGSYLQLTATQARIDATRAQVDTSQAIYKQAADRLEAGLATRVDVTRSQVQLQTEQQRLRSLRADFETQKLRLSRIIGLVPGQNFLIADSFRFAAVPDFTVETALQKAFQNRNDLRAASSNVKAAESSTKAAHAEHLPSLALNADFGAAGITPTHESTAVYSATGTLSIPIYEGGRIRGDIEQASAALRQRKAEYEDLRGQVDADVRQSFIDLDSAADQVSVAESNVGLAHQTLTQSRDRFTAGIADTVELVQAEQSVVQADDDYITAVFEHNLAKVTLARAMGNPEQTLPAFLVTK